MASTSNKILFEGLTFDDVLLVPTHSDVLPRDVSLKTRITRNLQINLPIVSAAMDTVTEAGLAIAIAREGGLGFLHKNMSIARQAEEVRRVKRADSGLIMDPITLGPKETVARALQIMREFKIGGIPVVDEHKKLLGVITNRDLRFEKRMGMLVEQLMTSDNLITAPEGTDLDKAEATLHEHRIEKLPVVNSENELIGLITYKDILKVQNHPHSCRDSYGRLLVGAAVGVTADMMERIQALVNVGVDVVGIDTAHGHAQGVLNSVRAAKDAFPNLEIMAGNVATEAAAEALIQAGADAIKVGVGPGSICTTRIVAGVGVPQLSAIMNASKAAKRHDVPVVGDGGIRYTGDVVKALVAGAETVMAGSIFAGVEESPGETIIYEGRKFKSYRGMGSVEAMKEGSKDRYFQDVEEDIKKLVPEGIVGRVPYKGTLSEVVYQYVGGLRAGMGYCGAASIQELHDKGFVKITSAGITESHVHDVTITKESPNYSR